MLWKVRGLQKTDHNVFRDSVHASRACALTTRIYYGFIVVLHLMNTSVFAGGQNGMYAVFDTYNLNVQLGAKGEMVSEVIQENTTLCLTLWYNMPTIKATLSIYKRYEDPSYLDELLWTQSYKTNGWMQSGVLIPPNEPFQIGIYLIFSQFAN